jgi:hypothetical protein
VSEVPLSAHTVTTRTEEIANDLAEQLLTDLRACDCFSLALDESTDITDTAQLSVYVRYLKGNEPHDSFLSLLPLKERTTGAEIKAAVDAFLVESKIPKEKLFSVTTDGAPAMTGSNCGLVGLLRSDSAYSQFRIAVHCIIHQQALCSKHANMQNVMSFVVKAVNFIKKSSSLAHRQFKQMLEDVEAEYGDLLLHSEVRWLSRGKVLDRFVNLLPEILKFMQLHKKPCSELEDEEWLADAHFLADITGHLNELNLQLQGKGKLVTDLIGSVNSFKAKLELYISDVTDSMTHFPMLSRLLASRAPDCQTTMNTDKYVNILKDLLLEFSGKRFAEFKMLAPVADFICNPFTNVPSTGITALASFISASRDVIAAVQKEICDLQHAVELKARFAGCTSFVDFWKLVPNISYPHLTSIVWRLMAVFGSTYACEQMFSTMKLIKSKERNRLSDAHLVDAIRITTATHTPRFVKLISSIQGQKSH